MPHNNNTLSFVASNVSCSEAMDWEIVRVTFDTVADDFDEDLRNSPFLSLNANFELANDVQIEFYDKDYSGGDLTKIDLWRDRVLAYSEAGLVFDISFEISTDSFTALRSYLKILCRKDCLQGDGTQ